MTVSLPEFLNQPSLKARSKTLSTHLQEATKRDYNGSALAASTSSSPILPTAGHDSVLRKHCDLYIAPTRTSTSTTCASATSSTSSLMTSGV